MKKKNILVNLKKIYKTGQILENEELRNYTSFKIGGVADFMVIPKTLEKIVKTMLFLQENNIAYYVLGNGTNVLASDKGFRGVIIKMSGFQGIEVHDNIIEVLAGTSLNKTCLTAQDNSLQGLEQGSGIPGTVGGAVIMNASAYDFETKKVVLGVLAIVEGKIKYFTNAECEFSYRNSIFKNYTDCVILRVDFVLEQGNYDQLKAIREETLLKRRTNQPLDLPSAGSVFKRIDGVIVSKMLDEEGLKGYNINDAEVSTKHAGFIVNKGNATAGDVKQLINEIKAHIKLKRNIDLIEEIKFIGDFD